MMKRFLFLFLSGILLLLFFAGLAPGYLAYSDPPRKSDVVVLFVGPGFDARQQEACRLVVQCQPKLLIVPAYNMAIHVDGAGISRIRQITEDEYRSFKARKRNVYRQWYEDTHVEVMETKRLMDANGARSAVLVSSPYHMRRIKLMSDSVFEQNRYTILLAPAKGEEAALPQWTSRGENLYRQLSEYAKIVWYIFYRPLMNVA
jgi:hypothetical protein